MFKGEYQGGPFVEVFSAQGRDPISKKCRVTGSSTNIHKQYEKDVKSYVYILEGEPTTTKIQFPKDDKQTLFLLQRFLLLQIFIPLGHSFSFELGVSDIVLNKRRIFFSSSQKDITVTPLHAKFPLTVLCLGTWLNLCLDLDSLVGGTFTGQTFRALESITVTANCRLRKIFTLKVPPEDTTNGDIVSYAKTEPLPKGLQFVTTPDMRPITQILSFGKLAQRPQNELPSSSSSVTSGNEAGSTPRQDGVETHIAFGQKVIIPPHIRKTSLKENQDNAKVTRPSYSPHSRGKLGHSAPDLRNAREESAKGKEKQPLRQKGSQQTQSESNEALTTAVNTNQALIQPRPPRTSSAGKVRRPVRVKLSSASSRSAKPTEAGDKQLQSSDVTKVVENSETIVQKLAVDRSLEDRLQNENINEEAILNEALKNVRSILATGSAALNEERVLNSYNDYIRRTSEDLTTSAEDLTTSAEDLTTGAEPRNEADENSHARLDPYKTENGSKIGLTNRADTLGGKEESSNISRLSTTDSTKNGQEASNISRISTTDSTINGALNISRISTTDSTNNGQEALNISRISTTDSTNNGEEASNISRISAADSSNLSGIINLINDSPMSLVLSADERPRDVSKSLAKQSARIDINNNEPLSPNPVGSNSRVKPRMLPLTSDNLVFTFASRPRSPRSGKKMLGSPVDDVMSPAVRTPEVMVSLAEDAGKDSGKVDVSRNRGALLEDDFCKLSDDESREDEDGIQKLLHSSLSPRHSPMPFHHHLRQSIRSSMLKEIPSPVKENGYDAQNYQSESPLATLNQSTASSWRFDTSDSSNGFNQTHEELEDSLNASHLKPLMNDMTETNVIVGNDSDEERASDGSDDTSFSTWRAPPQDLRGNKYQSEMKPPGNQPDLTATISMDPRDYCDVFSPPIFLPSSKQEHSSGDALVSPTAVLQSPAAVGLKQQHEVEEELDLLYDPCLNCYFDPKTHKYYELA